MISEHYNKTAKKQAYPNRLSFLLPALLVLFFLTPLKSLATAPFSVIMESRQGKVMVALHYEDASEMALVRARLEQDLPAVEYVFMDLMEKGLIDEAYPILVIEATKQFAVTNRFETQPTKISLAEQVTLVCNNPDMPQFDPRTLGPAYVIETTTGLLDFNDLLAMVIMLPDLGRKEQVLKIAQEESLDRKKNTRRHRRYLDLNIFADTTSIGPGKNRIVFEWRSGTTRYILQGVASDQEVHLEPLEVYITPPTWPHAAPGDMSANIVGYASPQKIVLYDIDRAVYHMQNIEDLSPEGMSVQQVRFMTDRESGKIYAVVSGILGTLLGAFSLELPTGVWENAFQDMPLYQASDIINSRMFDGFLMPFVPAFPSRVVRNADVIIEVPNGGLMAENKQWDATHIALLLGVLVSAIGLVWYLLRRKKRI